MQQMQPGVRREILKVGISCAGESQIVPREVADSRNTGVKSDSQ